MSRVIFSWAASCVLFCACLFFISEGYWLFATMDALICAIFAQDVRRELSRLERNL